MLSHRTALGRVGEADDVAEAIVAVLEMSWVTGQTVLADGGLALQSPIDTYGQVQRLRAKRSQSTATGRDSLPRPVAGVVFRGADVTRRGSHGCQPGSVRQLPCFLHGKVSGLSSITVQRAERSGGYGLARRRETIAIEPMSLVMGSAVLTASVTPSRIQENFDVVALPEEAIRDINERLETRFRVQFGCRRR